MACFVIWDRLFGRSSVGMAMLMSRRARIGVVGERELV